MPWFLTAQERRERENIMHIETTRYNDVIDLQIGAIQEVAQKLNVQRDLEELEAILAELEGTIADLRESLAAVPHQRR